MALFTFQYFSTEKNKAEVNDISLYIKDVKLVKLTDTFTTTKNNKGTAYSKEALALMVDGYVFCKWVSVKDNLAAMVIPSDNMIAQVNKLYAGHSIDSLLIESCKSSPEAVVQLGLYYNGFPVSAVAGLITQEQYNEFIATINVTTK